MNTGAHVNSTVATFIDSLLQRFSQLRWPRYLFHYTDILNVVGILENGVLLSRNAARASGVLALDCADASVISITDSDLLDYVRLYFRPRTPPLYRVEGFLPKLAADQANFNPCQVPIYLLFDSKRVLSLTGVEFSNANLATHHATRFSDPTDLTRLNFDHIYHDGPIRQEGDERKLIGQRKCAEVIVPESLSLQPNLSYVVCRSHAERELLLNMLSSATRAKLANTIIANGTCCNRHRQYVESVRLSSESIAFNFRGSSDDFVYRYEFESDSGKPVVEKQIAVKQFNWTRPPGNYQVTLYIDDHIAYKGQYSISTAPFSHS